MPLCVFIGKKLQIFIFNKKNASHLINQLFTIKLLDKGEERVSNPFFPLIIPHLSANCLTLFRWFVDSFFRRGFNSVKRFAGAVPSLFSFLPDCLFAGARLRARLRCNNGFDAT
jgi:hypothetical protein